MLPVNNFYKRLYLDNNDRSQYGVYKDMGLSDAEALDSTKELYRNYPNWFSVYAGQLPEVIIKPNKNNTGVVTLDTYYPALSKYPYSGHSLLRTPGGNTIDVRSSDPEYNLFLQNCSDATRKALELATGQRMNPWFFTTPGDVRSFAESVLNGKSQNMRNGMVRTLITLPQHLINTIAKYAQDLRLKKILRARLNRKVRMEKKLAMMQSHNNIEK